MKRASPWSPWSSLKALGKRQEDVVCVSYTSGTTGNPKGAMITHKNLVVMLKSTSLTDFKLTSTDVHLSYLPLAHLYERIMASLCILNGAKMGFYRGDGTYFLIQS
jgi:long-chain acyl-CoA synthetase